MPDYKGGLIFEFDEPSLIVGLLPFLKAGLVDDGLELRLEHFYQAAHVEFVLLPYQRLISQVVPILRRHSVKSLNNFRIKLFAGPGIKLLSSRQIWFAFTIHALLVIASNASATENMRAHISISSPRKPSG